MSKKKSQNQGKRKREGKTPDIKLTRAQKAAAKLAHNLSLDAIFVDQFRGAREAPEPAESTRVRVNIQGGEEERGEQRCLVYTIRFEVSSPSISMEGHSIQIHAIYKAMYTITDHDTRLTNYQIESFGAECAVRHVYPFAREYVQSMGQRMQLPALTLPLMISNQKWKKDR